MAFSNKGAAIGFALGGGLGAAAGGYADKLFGPGETSGYSKGDVERITNARHQQIQDFASGLAQARQRYLANFNNFQDLVFKRFVPNAEAQFAGRGLSVTGGAFQSALAKQAAQLQAQANVESSQMEREDLNSVNQAFGGLYGTQAGIYGAQPFQQKPNPFMSFAGQTAGLAGQIALLKAMGGTGGASSSGSVIGSGNKPNSNYYGV